MKKLFLFKGVLALSAFMLITGCGTTTTNDGANETVAETEVLSPTEEAGYIDATEAAAANYKLLSTEGNVRVIEMILDPGVTDNLHSHMYESAYFIIGGKVNIHVGEEVMEAEIPDGHIMHHKAWTHSVENVGETTVRAILFEQMQIDQAEDFANYVDATEVSPDQYQLLSHDGNVRVIAMTLEPGESDNQHSHRSESVYFLSGGKVKIYVGEEIMEAEIPDGHVMHHGPWSHRVENVGDTPIKAIIFERI